MKEGVTPSDKHVGKLVRMDEEMAEVLNNFFCLVVALVYKTQWDDDDVHVILSI